MKTYPVTRRERQRGSALITFLGVILIVSLAAAALVGFARQQAYSVGRTKDYIKAQVIAEAGANEAYSLLKENFAARNNADLFPEKTFGDGTYDATVTSVGSDMAQITCEATVGDATATAIMDVKNFGTSTDDTLLPNNPYAYTWLVNGECRMNGSSEFTGNLHANNNIDVNGSSDWGTATEPVHVTASGSGIVFSGPCTLYGDMQAPAISGSFSPGTVTESPVATVPFPTLDLTPYYTIATENGQVVGSQTISANTTWDIPGGVKWINGTLTVKKGTLTWTGCIIVTGAIDGKGTLNNTTYLDYPALVSRDSTITLSGQNSLFRGLMYSQGDILFSGCGGSAFYGSIFCGGNLRFNGSGGRYGYVYSGPGSGGASDGTAQDHVAVTAWQK